MYLVSILIPVYGVEKYIERCARSLFEQTYDNLEYIFVDDCSPDNSIAILKKVLEDYPERKAQVRIIRHERNKGLSAARNTATDAATGDYIFYLDSDDEITPDCIEIVTKPVLRNDTIEMVEGNTEVFYEGSSHTTRHFNPNIHEINTNSNKKVRNLFFTNKGSILNHAWNKLLKRSFLQQHQLSFKEGVLWEDILWSFFMMKHLNRLVIIPDVTYHYFVRPNSILTGSNDKERVRHLEIIYGEIANHLTEGEAGREVRHYIRGFCSRYFIYDSKSKTSLCIAKRFKEALSGSPFTSERRYLSLTLFLSKFFLGRQLFIFASKISKVIRGLKRTNSEG